MDLNIGDNVFYTRPTGLRVPAKVVGHSDEGYVELEYHQDGVRVINHHYIITLIITLQMTVGVVEFTDSALFCNVLCREGVQCNVVYLGGFSMGG